MVVEEAAHLGGRARSLDGRPGHVDLDLRELGAPLRGHEAEAVRGGAGHEAEPAGDPRCDALAGRERLEREASGSRIHGPVGGLPGGGGGADLIEEANGRHGGVGPVEEVAAEGCRLQPERRGRDERGPVREVRASALHDVLAPADGAQRITAVREAVAGRGGSGAHRSECEQREAESGGGQSRPSNASPHPVFPPIWPDQRHTGAGVSMMYPSVHVCKPGPPRAADSLSRRAQGLLLVRERPRVRPQPQPLDGCQQAPLQPEPPEGADLGERDAPTRVRVHTLPEGIEGHQGRLTPEAVTPPPGGVQS